MMFQQLKGISSFNSSNKFPLIPGDSSDSDFENDTDSENGNHTDVDNEDDSSDSDDLDVPNLREHPIEWTEDYQLINVQNFTCDSGPSLPAGWNPKSSPRDYFQLFWTDELLNNIVAYTNQYESNTNTNTNQIRIKNVEVSQIMLIKNGL